MPVLMVENTSIPYEIKRSPRAKRLRITVRPGRVEVFAPRLALRRTIVAFVESKRRWIHRKTESLRERALAAAPVRFTSGARVMFRGKSLRLRVEVADIPKAKLTFANAFCVEVPKGLDEAEHECVAKDLVMNWLKERALADARGWARRYCVELNAYPTRIRIGNQKTIWGSCSVRGVVSLNWRLIATPKPVFEYVVVHELCHLIEHNHGPRFWQLVQSLMPDYRGRRAWLKQRGIALG